MSLTVAVTHLNASVGPVLTTGQLAAALRAGSVHELEAESPTAAALVSSLFVELAPPLIMGCAMEAGAELAQVQRLYEESLADGMPPVPRWQDSVGALL